MLFALIPLTIFNLFHDNDSKSHSKTDRTLDF